MTKLSPHRMLLVLIVAFVAQQFSIQTVVTPIKPYMLLVIAACSIIFLALLLGKTLRLKLIMIDESLLVMYLYMMFTASFAPHVELALQMLVGMFVLLVSYFIVRVYSDRVDLDTLIGCLVTGAKIFFGISLVWYLTGLVGHYVLGQEVLFLGDRESYALFYGVYFEGIFPRLRGICDSPNSFGTYSVLFFPVWLACVKGRSTVWTCGMVITILLTLSITTYLAFIGIAVAFIVGKIIGYRFTVAIPSLRGAAILLFFVSVIMGGVISLLNSSFAKDAFDLAALRLNRIGTGSGRWEIWDFTVSLISEQPIFGYGLNQARVILNPLREGVQSTHNNFLEVFLEGGVMGLVFYVTLLGSLIFTLQNRNLRTSDRRWMSSALLGTFIFSNSNVNLYTDSTILILAVVASVYSKSSHRHLYQEDTWIKRDRSTNVGNYE